MKSDKYARDELRKDFAKLVQTEELSWRHNSRVLWLKEGDNNTKFFHKSVNLRSRAKAITKLSFNDDWITDPQQIANLTSDYFASLFTEMIE